MGTKVSVVIPAKNEPYLQQTIRDLLNKAKGDIEVIAVLDNYWPKAEELVDDPRVVYIHFSKGRGMRGAINAGVDVARGEYILKSDAHCLFGEGFDEILKANIQDNWIIIPRRYALDPVNWQIEDNPKYPCDYMYLSKDLHGVIWAEKNKDPKLKDILVDDLMSAQGSCWFMKNDYYHELELLDIETYGNFWNEFQEIGLKCWLSGGEVKVNKGTWYAHWHKTESRGYSLADSEHEKALAAVKRWQEKGWHKQTKPLSWLFEKFAPLPE